MATKGKQGSSRLSKSSERYVMQDGTRLKVPSLMGNTPRVSGVRTGNDKEFLKGNDGKLSKLQQNF